MIHCAFNIVGEAHACGKFALSVGYMTAETLRARYKTRPIQSDDEARTPMPINGLRVQAHQLLALALKAHEEGRLSDAYELTAKAKEHLEDALTVEELRRAPRPNRKRAHLTNARSP